jgi:excisionase family DNA binding protein
VAKLTVKLAAERAGVCTSVVYGWCAAGVLPHYRLGFPSRRGKLLIDDTDLEAYLASCRVGPADAPEPPPEPPLKLTHLRLRS